MPPGSGDGAGVVTGPGAGATGPGAGVAGVGAAEPDVGAGVGVAAGAVPVAPELDAPELEGLEPEAPVVPLPEAGVEDDPPGPVAPAPGALGVAGEAGVPLVSAMMVSLFRKKEGTGGAEHHARRRPSLESHAVQAPPPRTLAARASRTTRRRFRRGRSRPKPKLIGLASVTYRLASCTSAPSTS